MLPCAGIGTVLLSVSAARELLARPHQAQMRADVEREIMRLLMPGRDNAVASARTARIALVAAEYGLGALTAAQILLSWSCAGRIRNQAAFSMPSGTAPVPRIVRPYRPAPPQPARRPAAQPCAARHRRQPHAQSPAHPGLRPAPPRRNKTDREIRRCIKRYLARHLYRALNRG